MSGEYAVAMNARVSGVIMPISAPTMSYKIAEQDLKDLREREAQNGANPDDLYIVHRDTSWRRVQPLES